MRGLLNWTCVRLWRGGRRCGEAGGFRCYGPHRRSRGSAGSRQGLPHRRPGARPWTDDVRTSESACDAGKPCIVGRCRPLCLGLRCRDPLPGHRRQGRRSTQYAYLGFSEGGAERNAAARHPPHRLHVQCRGRGQRHLVRQPDRHPAVPAVDVPIIEDKNRMESVPRASPVEWVSVRLPNIVAGADKPIRVSADGRGIGLSITAESAARFMVEQAGLPQYLRSTPSISN